MPNAPSLQMAPWDNTLDSSFSLTAFGIIGVWKRWPRGAPRGFQRTGGGTLDKHAELLKLVEKRRQRDILRGYARLADYADGAFDRNCDFVSPYSKGAHNYDADVMILLQDWSSDAALRRSSCTKQGSGSTF